MDVFRVNLHAKLPCHLREVQMVALSEGEEANQKNMIYFSSLSHSR